MSRDVIYVFDNADSLLYQGELLSVASERFLKYLESQTDGEAMINSIQNGDHPLPVIAQVSLAVSKQSATRMEIVYLMDINIDALYNILKQNQGDEQRKEKVVVQSESEGSDDEDISDLKKITALLAKAFNRKKFYAKPTNNNLRTSSASSSATRNRVQEGHFFAKTAESKVKVITILQDKMLLDKKDSDEQLLLAEGQAWMEF
ncbi:hypothetical protein Tco_0677395 [Tanacetum coccineum]|uniref:Uncharacterized protein n=1 Tax=Tanacetum coccineum TaxID=301880 RepID=A0ABQ4XC51_9ASTR